jgi:broad specificity phosphatase PhoE
MQTGKIFLIRHGQTTGNGHHYVGQEDLPLNPIGQQQAMAIAKVLQDESIQAIYCSALNRAIATIQPLAEQKRLLLQTTGALNEIDYGAYQGRLKSELELKLRKDYRHRRLPGGESLYDVYLRVREFYQTMTQLLEMQQNLVIASHYWSIRMLFGILQNQAFDDIFSSGGYKPANGTIFEASYQYNPLGHVAVLSSGYHFLSHTDNTQSNSEIIL